jgi:hypothetical protein
MWSSIQKKVDVSVKSSTSEEGNESNMEDRKSNIDNAKIKSDIKGTSTNEEREEEETEKKDSKAFVDASNFGNSPDLLDEISISTKDSLGYEAILEDVLDLQTEEKNIFEERKPSHECTSYITGSDETRSEKSCEEGLVHSDNNKSDEEVDLDELSFHQEESMSFDSFQRIEKQAELRSKVAKHRQNLTSKLSILKSLSGDGDVQSKAQAEEQAEEQVEEQSDEGRGKVEENYENKRNPKKGSVTMNEEVFVDLGNLMYDNPIYDNLVYEENQAPTNIESSNVAYPNFSNDNDQVGLSKFFSTKRIFYAIVVFSIALNISNLFLSSDQNEGREMKEGEDLVSKATSLILIQLKLNKVHEEVMKLHLEKGNYPSRPATFLCSFIMIILISMMLWSIQFIQEKLRVANEEKEYTITSPNPKKQLQRELSSLDKKNIFPSTVTAPLVQKNGTLTEVKRSMRFSPEIKRFSPGFKTQSKKEARLRLNLEKRANIFSPKLKMNTIKESK